MKHQVTAWRPDRPHDRDRTIDLLRTTAGDLTPDQVASLIELGRVFYVQIGTLLGGFEVELEIGGVNIVGKRWVRTKPNGRYDDNLYALPKF